MQACKRICCASFQSVCFSLARQASAAAAAAAAEAARRPCRGHVARTPARARCVAGASCRTAACRPRTCERREQSREVRARRLVRTRGEGAAPLGCALVLVVLALGVRRPPAATQRVRAARARRVPRGRAPTTAGQRALRAGDILAQRVLQRRLFLARSALAVYRAHHRVGHRHRGRHVRGRRRRSCAGAIGRCHVVGSCLAASGAAVLSARPRDGAGYKKCRERR